MESTENLAKCEQKQRKQSQNKFLRKAMCCNLQHFFQNKATDSRSVLSHDAISCVLSNIESQEKPVNTDVFATSENVQNPEAPNTDPTDVSGS